MDVWSYGLVVQEMAIGKRPDPGKRSQQVEQVTCPKLKELVTACIEFQPLRRPSMPEVVRVLIKERFFTE